MLTIFLMYAFQKMNSMQIRKSSEESEKNLSKPWLTLVFTALDKLFYTALSAL